MNIIELTSEIKQLGRLEIDAVMDAVTKWFRDNHPAWSVYYCAVPNEPEQREKALMDIYDFIQKDLEWSRKQYCGQLAQEK